jgi:hypothetical protein
MGRKENKQVHLCTGMLAPGTVGKPAIAKRIHREDPTHILGHQPHMAVATACHHFP